jgi:Transposase IS4
MDMDKKVPRGSIKMAYCKDLGLAAFQWNDSKVVNCLSSYLNFDIGTVKSQVGSESWTVQCPKALIHYQVNMGGVDRIDQMRLHFGGFASQSHFKKWYKRVLLAVLDCILLNGLALWSYDQEQLERYEFIYRVSEDLLHYYTPEMTSPIATTRLFNRGEAAAEEGPEEEEVEADMGRWLSETEGTKRCVVCSLEASHYEIRAKELRKLNKLAKNDPNPPSVQKLLTEARGWEAPQECFKVPHVLRCCPWYVAPTMQ